MNRVLVVDDHEPNLALYAKVIAQIPDSEAFKCLSARSGLAWVDANDPALIVIDQEMPEVTGTDFILHVRSLRGRAETPIIMITADTDRELRREALQRGASAVLTKPVDPIEFLALARNFIAARNTRVDAANRAGEWLAKARELSAELEQRDRDEIEALFRAVELRDSRLADHMARTALISERIALRAGVPQANIQGLAIAARVHDIGKLGIPDRVLYKTSKLMVQDRDIARKHAEDGYEVLRRGHSPLIKLAAEIAKSHHERFDGKGYPAGLVGEATPLAARIVGLADVFSAMTARRPWREAFTISVTLDSIERESGAAFDPKLVSALREAMPEVLEARAKVPDLLR